MSGNNARAFAKALLDGRFLINVNNFVAWPARTGIQRVCYEFCTRWPHIGNTVPFVELGPDRIGILTPDVFEDIRNMFEHDDPVLRRVQAESPTLGMEPNVGWLGLISAKNRIAFEVDADIALDVCRAVISLEESLNLDFYSFAARYRPEKIFNLCHDFLSWTHAQHFNIKWDHADNVVISLENRRRYRNNFFTSTAMREQYITRINRGDGRDYYVIPPGADGLGRSYRQQVPVSDEFVVVGTLEPRKQPIQILEAFERVNSDGHIASLCFAGRMGWLAAEDRRRLLKAFETYPWLRWVDGPDDEALRSLMQNSRATIYLSLAEGFGSPPVESLALGVPCIVSAVIPSVLDMPANGQVRIKPEDGAALVDAVRGLLDDASVLTLQKEIETLPLPRWQGFVDGIVAMIEERAPLRDDQQPLSYAQSLSLLCALGQMREISRDRLIKAILKAVKPDVGWIQVARVQDEARAVGWTNVDVVLNLAAQMPAGTMPAAFVQAAVQSNLAVQGLRPDHWRSLQSWFRGLLREPEYRLYVGRIFSDLHGRSADAAELEAQLPDSEMSQTRLRALMEALGSKEYATRQAHLAQERAPDGYFDRVEVQSTVWMKGALTSLANEVAVDRALLIEDDFSFIETASLDLMAQLPSQEQVLLWRGWASTQQGRYRVLLGMLTSRACLLKVIDAQVHLELVHDVARRAGLASRQKMTALQLAGHVVRALSSSVSSEPFDLGMLIDDGDVGRDGGIGRLIERQDKRDQAVAFATLWLMASGRAEWNEALLNWAGAQLNSPAGDKSSLTLLLTASSTEQFRAAFGRSATSEELLVLSEQGEGLDVRVKRLAVLVTGARLGELADISEALRTVADEAAMVVAEVEAIERLSVALEAAAPRRFGQVFRTVRSEPDACVENGKDEGAAKVPDVQLQAHADGDISSLEQLFALDGEDFVRRAYKKILLREADGGGLATYLNLLRSGKGKPAVVRSLALSEEGRSKGSQLFGLQPFLDSTPDRPAKRKKGWKRLFRLKL
ncbi:Glycosyl transferases group 1 [Brevundimonas sp. SH203]|uniref:glycosyltransferase n=1 Tax=Brevundimonas sp. SH203 TaxID=345167 RepID=UPI0009D296B3|nr:glycosyltransferase [Brevundimonas sp. SH203]GAW42082.1 Glycosyl transferases group 1 [Brevundimonas sp. SH203]